jgi:predicted Zn-dependent protease
MIRVGDLFRIPSAIPHGAALSGLALMTMLAGCTTNAATGKTQLATFMSAEDEAAAGASAHPKIIATYGGVYDDPKVGAYVADVTRRIAAATQMPNQPYRLTVLDSPIVNAFALPGGYVYVTRGLLSLVDDEAELAGVVGHEIGHVIARHGAQRQTAALGASVLGAVVGAVVGNAALNQAVGLGGQGLIASYSRDQEYESDTLGVHYLAKAGYDPYAQGDFLAAMDENAKAEAIIAGQSASGQANWLSSHPATPQRVAAARREAQATGVPPGKGERNRAALFKAINGMIYGDSPAQGMVREQSFIHPVAKFRFDAPKGYRIINGADAVTVVGPAKVIAKFDSGKKPSNVSIDAYLAQVWAKNVQISRVERFQINGLNAARASARVGNYDAMLVAIEAPGGVAYRFLLGLPQGADRRYGTQLMEVAQSFRMISASEAAKVKPLRLRVVRVKQGDTVASLAGRMAFSDHKVERFRALNGLPVNASLQAGEEVKIVAP